MTKALQEKKPVMVQTNPSVADSLSVAIASNKAFNIIKGYLDKMVKYLYIYYIFFYMVARQCGGSVPYYKHSVI